MIKSLYTKLALVLLGLFCLLGISMLIVTYFALEMYHQEAEQKLNRDLARQMVSHEILIEDGQISEKGLADVLKMLMIVNPNIEIYLLDPGGEILSYSAPAGKVKLDRVDMAPINNWFEDNTIYPLTGDDPRHPGTRKVFSAARIPEQGPLQGYLYIILGSEIFDSIAMKLKSSYIMRVSALWIIASLIFVLVTGLILFAYLTRRLRRLSSIMDSFDLAEAAGRLQSIIRDGWKTGDEIDRLAFTVKQLVDRIQTQMEDIKNSDTLRRELIANVSHDLRTPLATLRGYIESLYLKNKTLTEKEQLHHLKIAILHCKRLSKLVDKLFELARLESQETAVCCEPFNINELAHDVAQKFHLSAQQRKINIRIDQNRNLPFVNADIALIERVMENLIDNALRHTSKGGSINLTFSRKNGDIAVRVSDTGAGIPEEDLPHIFNRFYQRSRTQDGKIGHAGLGLAITKRILELHDRSIMVESEFGSGTTFTFNLPTWHPA